MPRVTFAEATRRAMEEEMARDDRVFLMGEDIAKQGGIFGQFKGLAERFGTDRVRDTPISEAVLVSSAVGAAMVGARPVLDIHFADFLACAMDEVVNQAAKIRYMSGGQVAVPLVIRAPDGAIRSAGAHHSQSPEAWFVHTPGLRVVAPSTPADALGLLKSAIRSDDPVIYFEHKALYTSRGEIPDGEHLVPLGSARVARPGGDVTVLSWSRTRLAASAAAEELAADGIDVEVVDLRSLSPIDWDTVLGSARKTRRVVVAHEAPRTAGMGAELAATITEELFGILEAPVVRVCGRDVPMPFAPELEAAVVPRAAEIVDAVVRVVEEARRG